MKLVGLGKCTPASSTTSSGKMIPKLTENWAFKVYPGLPWQGGVWVDLWELNVEKPREKDWYIAGASVDNITHHMNSLTDELCEQFFPKPRLSKEEKKALKLAKQSNE